MDDRSFFDATIFVYLTTILLSLYGTVLFAWWWLKQGTASSVFAYVTFVFVGECVESCFALYARILAITCGEAARHSLVMSPVWPARKLVTLLALGFIVTHMTHRAFFKKGRHDDR